MAVKRNTITTPQTEQTLLDALLYVSQQDDDYTIKGLCNEMREMIFIGTKTGDSPGRVFAATVVPDPGGAGAVLQLSVGLAPNAMPSFSNSRKNQDALDLLIRKVETALAEPGSSRPEPMASHAVQWDGTVVPWTSGDFPEDPDES